MQVTSYVLGTLKSTKCKLYNVVTNNKKCDIEISRHIGIAVDAFQKISNVLKDTKMLIERKEKVLMCYVISNQ